VDSSKELRVFLALRELHDGIGMERNGTGTNGVWPNGKYEEWLPGDSMMVLFWMFLLLSGCACSPAFAVALRSRLPVVDCGMAMACFSLGKAGHGIACSVFCITKRLERRCFDVSRRPSRIFDGNGYALHWVLDQLFTSRSKVL
jgi:hypothetical protein